MGIVLIFLALLFAVTIISILDMDYYDKKKKVCLRTKSDMNGYVLLSKLIKDGINKASVALLIMCVSFCFITIFGLVKSYDGYVDMRSFYDRNLNQYRGAIELYEHKAVLNVDKCVTDFYAGKYNEQMAVMITELRKNVTEYNKEYVSKKIYGKNFFFGWYTVMPDEDMKPIEILSRETK